MLQIFPSQSSVDQHHDNIRKTSSLVYGWGYIYLRQGNMVRQFREGIDISYLAEEFRAARISFNNENPSIGHT